MIASVKALEFAAADRSTELTSLKRLNTTRAQERSMLTWEMVLTVGPAWLLGLGATAWMALAMAGGDAGAAAWAFPTPVLLLIGVGGLLAAVGGSLTVTGSIRPSTEDDRLACVDSRHAVLFSTISRYGDDVCHRTIGQCGRRATPNRRRATPPGHAA